MTKETTCVEMCNRHDRCIDCRTWIFTVIYVLWVRLRGDSSGTMTFQCLLNSHQQQSQESAFSCWWVWQLGCEQGAAQGRPATACESSPFFLSFLCHRGDQLLHVSLLHPFIPLSQGRPVTACESSPFFVSFHCHRGDCLWVVSFIFSRS